MTKTRKILAFFLIILILATICFIWSNSIKGKGESSASSASVYDDVVEIVSEIIGVEGAEKIFNVITHQVFRKIAHAGEFAVLGLEFFFLFLVLGKISLFGVGLMLIFGFSVGGIDEIIQIFSNRGPSFLDVLIDFAGFFLAIVICLGIYFIVNAVKRKKIKKNF